jgi:hypothetical protein
MSESSMGAELHSLALAESNAIKTGLELLQDFDFTKGYELDRRLKADPNLLAEFVQNPPEVAKREVGLEPPQGFHMHFINENNEYLPAEGDAISQLELGRDGSLWSRVEIRMAAGPGCYALCFICKGS